MRGHLHSDVISIAVTTVGVFVTAHLARVAAAKMGGSSTPLFSAIGKGVGGFFTLGE